MKYNSTGKQRTFENLAGQITTTAWDCCHKVSEVQPDGSTTTWDYDDEGRMIATSRLIPLDMTNVTWLTTCYRYDDLGRQTATWQTNYAAQVGLPATRTRYDQLGRVIARVDTLGNITTTEYSPDGRTVFVRNPNTSTRVTTRSASGDILSITGTAVTPEFHTYGILPDGTRWSRTVHGETASSPRFTKRYENLLAQTVREERSGFKGSVLATTHAYDSLARLVSSSADYEPAIEYTYDTLGNRIATTRLVGASVPARPPEWRKTETLSSFILDDSIVWLTQTNIVSCSDSSIAPLVSFSARQLTGLTSALPSHSRSTDVRGNVTENETLVDSSFVTSRQTVPYATNKPLSISRYGASLMDVSVSSVTNTVAYDPLGRQIAHTDGRGNTIHAEYNAVGQRSASIDALGNRTTYAYDQFGNLSSVTDPLGNATVYEYDLRGRKTLEYGATYPVRYTYDIFDNKTSMMTFRAGFVPDASASGDTTTWLYDIASGAMTNKVYADGKGPTYNYTPSGKLSRRIWARGITTDYTYDDWGNLTNTVYSDGTPTIALSYDVLGRQTEARDAAGVTTFAYEDFGAVTNETVVGVAGTNTIERCYDSFGRSLGYALNGVRQSTLGYDPATGRLATMQTGRTGVPPVQGEDTFTWSYLPGSDLKSSLSYPNGLTASWQYDANNQLLQVKNAFPTNTISQYDYVYDAAGRRVQISRSGSAMSETRTDVYGYNIRSELISAAKLVGGDSGAPQTETTEYAYEYDDIGNRLTSLDLGTNRTYTANNLNQYTQISNLCDSASLREEFLPQFDEDGNQALIQTATGIWFVTYNGENRPVLWSCGATNIVMSFDRIGRRVLYLETSGAATNSSDTFTYDNYLCVARHRDGVGGASATDRFVWDPTEPVATRPLVFCQPTTPLQFYTHDGNKNVSEIVFFQQDDGIAAHYEYAPFGAVTATGHTIPASAYDFCEYNSFRFSSEYYDILISLHSYNFRCYDSLNGRWCTRDMLHEQGFRKSHEICKSSLSVEDSFYEDFQFVKNAPLSYSDYLGLKYSLTNPFKVGQVKFENCSECQLKSFRLIPEHYSKGEELKVPNAGWNSSVDGVWVEGIQKWLKIPNHCYATIICSKGCDFEYRWKCNAFLSLIQKIRGKIYEVDFVPDQGETNHPTNYPF